MGVIKPSIRPNLGGLEYVVAHGSMGAAETIDLGGGNVHTGTLDANCTLTFTGASSGLASGFTLVLTQDGTGSRVVTWPVSVTWPDALTPTLATAAGAVDVFTFHSTDGGTVWYGFHSTAPTPSGLDAGTSNPGSPSTGDLFYRTDLGLIIKYDGTRWVCICPHDMALAGPFDGNATAVLNGWPMVASAAARVLSRMSVLHTDYQLWLESLYGETFVDTTNDGSNFWTYSLTGGVTSTAYGNFTTAADSPGGHVGHKATLNVAAGGTERGLILTLSKTGTPGDLYGSVAVLSYRRIVT